MSLRLQASTGFGPFAEFDPVDLPTLSILTGENGSGKTQLLRAIAGGQVTCFIDEQQVAVNQIRYLTSHQPSLQLEFSIQQARGIEEGAVGSNQRVAATMSAPARQLASKILKKPATDLLSNEIRAFAVDAHIPSGDDLASLNLGAISMGFLRKLYYRFQEEFYVSKGRQTSTALLEAISPDVLAPWQLASQVLEPFGFSIEGPPLTIEAKTET